MEIDHVFMFVDPDGAELKYLHSLGLVETYRRTHPGQGTRNVCFCFDNMFLECLWVSDVDEVGSDAIARTGLYERSQWRTAGTCPFGIAWRTDGDGEAFDPPVWAFRPPYLPSGMSIDVSVDGDDPRQPMMFRSPGTTPPVRWTLERRGHMQRAAGLGRILAIRLDLPEAVMPSPTLASLAKLTFLDVQSVSGNTASMTFDVERRYGDIPLIIRLPVNVHSQRSGKKAVLF